MSAMSVCHTNDCSIVSKASMCAKGYASDHYLQHFVSRPKSRSPLINRGYYLRHKAIEWALNYCEPLDAIISLGSGFDTLPLRVKCGLYIEIDLPNVAKCKANVLIEKDLMKGRVNGDLTTTQSNDSTTASVVFQSSNYCLIGADLRKAEEIYDLIVNSNILGEIENRKVCLLNECALCYVTPINADRIIKVFTLLFKRKNNSITYIGYEQINNRDNQCFSSVMLNHFEKIYSPLLTFLTPSQQKERFQLMNYDFVNVMLMSTFYEHCIDRSEKHRIERLEDFDEYEEFDLLCKCYALTIASTQELVKFQFPTDSCVYHTYRSFTKKPKCQQIEKNMLLDCFGHSSCLSKNNEFILFDGFGCESSDGKTNSKTIHKRLSRVVKVNTENQTVIRLNSEKINESNGRIHSQLAQLDENLIFISGGRRSPSVVCDNNLLRLLPDNSYQIESIACFGENPPKVYRHLCLKMINANKLIQFGGKINENRYLNESIYYELDTNTFQWQKKVISNIDSYIHSLSGVALNSNIFIVNGGLRCDTNQYSSSDIYLIDDRFPSSSQIKIDGLTSLYSHKMNRVSDNQILITGGIECRGMNTKINLIDLRCHKITDSFMLSDSSIMLHNFSSELISSDGSSHLWLIGGGGNCFSFGTHFNLSSIVQIL